MQQYMIYDSYTTDSSVVIIDSTAAQSGIFSAASRLFILQSSASLAFVRGIRR